MSLKLLKAAQFYVYDNNNYFILMSVVYIFISFSFKKKYFLKESQNIIINILHTNIPFYSR